ncbi:MAG: hypothetical protein QM770_14570 [Tepidisphaeraceae bacterium]
MPQSVRRRKCRSTQAVAQPLEARRLFAVIPTTGALAGKTVFLNGGHGFAVNGTTWSTGRGETFEMVEDLGNQDQLRSFADYVLNAGGAVAALRPIGHQTREIVLDNDSAGVTFTGTWNNSASTIYYDEDYGAAADAVPYRYASTTTGAESAVAKYAPTFTTAGFYPVYTWARAGTDRTSQLYRINYTGGSREVRVDHRDVGNGWVYLGTYYFAAGASGNVQISNNASAAGAVVIADAIRFGNGMGDVDPGTGVSGLPREDEACLYWIQRAIGQGANWSSIRGSSTLDSDANVGALPRFARLMFNGAFGDGLFLSYHSNAAGGRGTVGLNNEDGGTGNTPNQLAWAKLIGQEVNDDMVAQAGMYEYDWFDAGTNVTLDRSDIDFGEINNAYISDEFDATICEVAYHDDPEDAALLRDPRVRDAVGKASYQAAVRYFNQFGGAALNFAPGVPTNVNAVTNANRDIVLSWTAPVANAYNGSAATSYRVMVSRNGYGFGDPVTTASTTLTLPAASLDDATYYFQIVAVNAGGESKPSVTVGARSLAVQQPRVLVVNGFDRYDRTLNDRQTTSLSFDPPTNSGSATIDRVRPRYGNTFDYIIQAARSIEAYATTAIGIDNVQNEAVISGLVNLANYDAVIWQSGEESSDNKTFDATEQSKVAAYLSGGGKFFVSGSEIGWDLDNLNNGRSFYNTSLRADYVNDDANTYNATGTAAGIFSGVSISFDNGVDRNINYPDVLAALGGSTVAMNYVGGTGGGAAVQYSSGNTRLVNVGFPVEAITSESTRNTVFARVLDYFALQVAPVVTGSQFLFQTRPQVDFTFSKDVSASLSANDLVLTRTNGSGALPTVTQVIWNAGTKTASFVLANTIADGDYLATLPAASASDTAGKQLIAAGTRSFFMLAGDANRDRTVNFSDLLVVASNYGLTSRTFSQGDFNYDGQTNFTDLLMMAARYGTSLAGTDDAVLTLAGRSPVAAPSSEQKTADDEDDDSPASSVLV